MKLADYDETLEIDLEPNAFECVEHDEIFELSKHEEFDVDETQCPYDEGHYVAPMFACAPGELPETVPADVARDFYHPVRQRYEIRLDPDE